MAESKPENTTGSILEMMERLGLDPAGGIIAHSSLTYLTALHRCQACQSKAKCRDWLDSMPMSVAFAPPFCPNRDVFFEMQVDQPGHIKGPCNDLCTAHKPAAGLRQR